MGAVFEPPFLCLSSRFTRRVVGINLITSALKFLICGFASMVADLWVSSSLATIFGLCIKLGGALSTVILEAEVVGVVDALVVPGGITLEVDDTAGNRGGGAVGGRISLGGGIPKTQRQ